MNKISLLFIKCLANVMLFCGIPTTILMPFFLKWYGRINDYYAGKYFYFQAIMFLVCGYCACVIVAELRKMLKTIDVNDCFVMANVSSLKRMAIHSFVISIACLGRLLLYSTPGAFCLVIVFLVAGLLSNVLAAVFEKAVEYKLENDMTI